MADTAADAPPGPPAPASLHQQLRALWRELPGLLSDRVDLLSLELQRALQALVEIAALLVAVAILGVTAWLVLWGAIIGLLVAVGLPLAAALLLAIAVNAVVIVLAVARVRRLLPRLGLPATRRHLMPHVNPWPEEGDDEFKVAGQPGAH